MNLSVIIPAYNHLDKVLKCLNSLQAFAVGKHQYIVQDDASPEYNFLALIPDCLAECYRNEVNLGFAGNSNTGAAHATGDILLFCNQDIYGVDPLSRGWDTALVRAFDNPQVGIVGARLLFETGEIQSAGGQFDGKVQPTHRPWFGYTVLTHPEINEPREVGWTTGAALAIRREVWHRVGGFDTSYVRGYFEDVEICLKARELGYCVMFEPGATFIHPVGSTGGNPYFMHNARLFHERWVATGKVKPDTQAVYERFW